MPREGKPTADGCKVLESAASLRATVSYLPCRHQGVGHLPVASLLCFHSEIPLMVPLSRCLFSAYICWSGSPWPEPIGKVTHDHQVSLDLDSHLGLEAYGWASVSRFAVRAALSGYWDHKELQLWVSISQDIPLQGECLTQGQLLPNTLSALRIRNGRSIQCMAQQQWSWNEFQKWFRGSYYVSALPKYAV